MSKRGPGTPGFRCCDTLSNPIHDGDRVYDGYEGELIVVPWDRDLDVGCREIFSLSVNWTKDGVTKRTHINSNAVFVNEVDAIAHRVKESIRDNEELRQRLKDGEKELQQLKLRLAELRGEVIVLEPAP